MMIKTFTRFIKMFEHQLIDINKEKDKLRNSLPVLHPLMTK